MSASGRSLTCGYAMRPAKPHGTNGYLLHSDGFCSSMNRSIGRLMCEVSAKRSEGNSCETKPICHLRKVSSTTVLKFLFKKAVDTLADQVYKNQSTKVAFR